MKIAVFSDSHRCIEPMEEAVRLENPDAVIHLGDHEGDAYQLGQIFPGLVIYSVAGNCDLAAVSPIRIVTTLGGVTVFLTHGHEYGVKFGYAKIVNTAMSAGADIAMFGHTHQETYEEQDGFMLINPGAISSYTKPYGILTVENGKAKYEQKHLSR